MIGRFRFLGALALALAAAPFAGATTLVVAGTTTSGPLTFSSATQNSIVTDQDTNASMALLFTAAGTGVYHGIGFSVAAELSGGSTAIFSIYDDGDDAGMPVDLLATTQLFNLSQTSFQLISGSFAGLTLTGGEKYYLAISLPVGVPGNQWVDLAGTRTGTLGPFELRENVYPPTLWTSGFGGLPAYQITAQSLVVTPEPSTAALVSLAFGGAIALRTRRRRAGRYTE